MEYHSDGLKELLDVIEKLASDDESQWRVDLRGNKIFVTQRWKYSWHIIYTYVTPVEYQRVHYMSSEVREVLEKSGYNLNCLARCKGILVYTDANSYSSRWIKGKLNINNKLFDSSLWTRNLAIDYMISEYEL